MSLRYFAIYKPYGMLSQFTKEGDHKSLADLFDFPKDVYPLGRLDTDSEGLLVLSNDKKLNHALLNPSNEHERSYYVQVEGLFNEEARNKLEGGVTITVNGKQYGTLPCAVQLINSPGVPERTPPIRVRKTVPDSWIKITLKEGKNRQVRKMTAAVGFPTLRLIRYSLEQLTLDKMLPGDVRELTRFDIYNSLNMLS